MHDTMLAACANIVGPAMAENRQPEPKHERNTGGAAFYQIYPTRDGRYIVLAGQERKFIENLLGALDRPDLVAPCLQGPGPHQQPVIAFLRDVFGQKTLQEAVAWLSKLDVCFGPVNTLPEAFEDANVKARGMVLVDGLGRRHIAPAIHFADEPAAPSLREPSLGQHTEEILGPLRSAATTRSETERRKAVDGT
jgi:crotonobetainyl-CoA:carnitine CoA-transferase CaiB-like acyl-CoA transferase